MKSNKLNNIFTKLNEEAQTEFIKNKTNLYDKIASILSTTQPILDEEKKEKTNIKMPKIFNMDIEKFMICEMNEFYDLVKNNGYRKVTSSLNYLYTFSAKEMPNIKKRVEEIRSFLKNWKAEEKKSQGKKEEKNLIQETCEQPKSENMSKSSEGRLPISEAE